tara:strand:- start:73 stop:810 length:738 start_codon:yes stop_codon:yes gene_type:complete
MISDEEPKLIFTNLVLISSFYESSIIRKYNDLKNRLLKRNAVNTYEPVELSPLSQIYKSNWVKIKDNWPKDLWENEIKEVYKNNTEGEWVFEYKATFEMSYYDTKEYFTHYEYEQNILGELERDYGGYLSMDDPDSSYLESNRPYPGITWHGIPKPEEITYKEIEYKLKFKKWLEKNSKLNANPVEWEMSLPYGMAATSNERLFKEDKNEIIVTDQEIKNYIHGIKKDMEERRKKQEEEIIESWK